VLITDYTVLTAASCLVNAEGGFYEAGQLQLALGSLIKTTKVFTTEVLAIKTHGRFNQRTLANNIALIEVPKLEFSTILFPIYAPVWTSDVKAESGEDCYVLGWKSLVSHDDDDDEIAQQIQKKTLSIC